MGWKEVSISYVKKLLLKDLSKKMLNFIYCDNNFHFLRNSNKRAVITEVNKNLLNVFNEIKKKGIQPLFLGRPVCDVFNNNIRLALPFLSDISSEGEPKVIINEKAEQLFLYSRDIWSSSILRMYGAAKKGNIVFIFNDLGLFLGIAFALYDDLLGKGKKVVLKNIIDIGYYLRCERR